MIVESIFLGILIISLGGVIFILNRKIPELISLPQNGGFNIKEYKIISSLENKLKSISVFFEKQIFLHKILSLIKVLILKIETRIDHLLHKIRQKNKSK